VFFGMIGVTAFGLIFTPVFYVIARWIAQLGARSGKKHAPGPQAAE
jgi:HAE1 family hydrophobic/amphiphilic exporter-1